MKMKQVKKLLSITLATAMLVAGTPAGSFASETGMKEQSAAGSQDQAAASAEGQDQAAAAAESQDSGETAAKAAEEDGQESTPAKDQEEKTEVEAAQAEALAEGETAPGQEEGTDSGAEGNEGSQSDGAGSSEAAPETEAPPEGGTPDTGTPAPDPSAPEEGETTGDDSAPGNEEPEEPSPSPGGETTPGGDDTGDGTGDETGGETGDDTEVTVTWRIGDQVVDPSSGTADITWKSGLVLSVDTSGDSDAFSMTVKRDGNETTAELNETGSYQAVLKRGEQVISELNFNVKKAIREFQWENLSAVYTGASWETCPKAVFFTSEGEGPIEAAVSFDGGSPVNCGRYGVTAYLKPEQVGHYKIVAGETKNTQQVFEITRVPIEIKVKEGQSKYYGADDPAKFQYTVTNKAAGSSLTPEAITGLLAEEFSVGADKFLTRREPAKNENAGKYGLELFEGKEKDSKNFDITYLASTFEIKKLPITILPDEDQSKLYGQADPESYDYTVALGVKKGDTALTVDAVQKELGKNVIDREPGEEPGNYKYVLIPEDSGRVTNYGNFDVAIAKGAPYFEIGKIAIMDVEEVDSRQESFKVTTNLSGKRTKKAETRVNVEVLSFPRSKDGITFSKKEIKESLEGGAPFTGSVGTVDLEEIVYQKKRKDMDGVLHWVGYLPADTKIRVSIVDDKGKMVSANYRDLMVSSVPVSFDWSGYENGVSGNYFADRTGESELILKAGADVREDEWIEISYKRDVNGEAEVIYEDSLNYRFSPDPNNSGTTHMMQSVTANVMDTLNLECEPQELQFYVDDMAFEIPSSSIQFENRGREITVQLPEYGTISGVSIPGAQVSLPGGSATEFRLPVSWSGTALIPTGSQISVTYTDLAGHQGAGSTSASQSSVATPIAFGIRPELNANGYLNGRGNTLIVSGTACSCEPIMVSVADMTQSVNAAQTDVWSDSNGSWEALFDMSRLPEGQDFTIRAEYMDVSGAGYSINAKFDSFCASPATFSPIYEAMTHINGMVETDTAVALVVNGETQNYYEIPVDRFGHFSMNDVPMMFGGEDSFDIYVTDIAGNVSIRHYEIPEPGDPFEVSSQISPLGKFFYSAQEEGSDSFAATPVSAGDFEKGTVEIPLLMGMSYEVGTLTLQKTENGFTASSRLGFTEELDPEDYRVGEGKLYVYASRPSVEDLKNKTGAEYAYGAEIPLGEGTVWIAGSQDMTILADEMAGLELYDYGSSKAYVRYQEQ